MKGMLKMGEMSYPVENISVTTIHGGNNPHYELSPIKVKGHIKSFMWSVLEVPFGYWDICDDIYYIPRLTFLHHYQKNFSESVVDVYECGIVLYAYGKEKYIRCDDIEVKNLKILNL